MKCPTCITNELTPFKVGEPEAHSCAVCRGLWLSRDEFEAVKKDDHEYRWFDIALWEDHAKLTAKEIAYFNEFKTNLFSGIEYYRPLFPKMRKETSELRKRTMEDLMD